MGKETSTIRSVDADPFYKLSSAEVLTTGELIDRHQRLSIRAARKSTTRLEEARKLLEDAMLRRIRANVEAKDEEGLGEQLYQVNFKIDSVIENSTDPRVRELVILLQNRMALVNEINRVFAERKVYALD